MIFNLEEGVHLERNQQVGTIDSTQLVLQKRQIEAMLNTLPQKLRNSLAEIEVLQHQKKNLVRERDRIQRLVDKKAATNKQLDDLNGELNVLDQKMEAISSSTSIANRAILAEKGPLLAKQDLIEEQISRAKIINPVNGTVLTKMAEQYELVGMGTPLYRIGQLDTMIFKFYASSHQLQDLKVGQAVEILIDKGQDDFTSLNGTISWIAEEAEFTPKTIQTKEDRVNLVYAVKALVPNPNGTLKIGMPGEVNFNHTKETTE
jgi:HlyD family secretion protein